MDKSRTRLEKWIAAIDLLSASNGANAVQLAASIGVSHKVAWTMLRKFRFAIQEVEAERRLAGDVRSGLRALAPAAIFTFLEHRRYRCERVVSVSAAVDSFNRPIELSFVAVQSEHLRQGWKELNGEGKDCIAAKVFAPCASRLWLSDHDMDRSPLRECFREASDWLNRLYNGVGSAYLQTYLYEFCFRWNIAAKGASLRDEWNRLCFPLRDRKQATGPLAVPSAA
jgi:hypothetical protein